ncbi:efflux transporter outer membrane subunit [Pseudomonas azotoformans]|uniref:efflux transporter outer membrane subunit n=1 Tax=Pseudomonas azotoformans TaxID=47878 RepID=UPI00087B28DC|nr:efflux transporter outer membrane subunit [Pseudomonas azotoformans]SDM84587.1 efflux transporter, outer membrane factor (OMF) lipoprotein, NodT family [Pseudomonas azotoformans]
MIKLKHWPLSVLVALLQGCTVGPDYHRPQTPDMPATFSPVNAEPTAGPQASAAGDEFWNRFEDPELTSLVKAALAANYDLRTALANYDAANALLRLARFDQLPTVTLSAQAGHQRNSTDEANGAARSHDVLANKAALSWELDFLGRVRRAVESQQAETEAKANDLYALQVAVVRQVASTYIDLRAAQKMLALSTMNADSQRETLTIVRGRLDAGRGSSYDLSRAQALLDTTLSRIPSLEARMAMDRHRLAVLVGLTPTALDTRLQHAADTLSVPATIEPDTPAQIIRRRPDVASAEQQLHAATARVGVATADLFPRVSLGAAVGTYAFSGGALYSSGAESNLALLGIDWSFLDVGRVKSRIAASDAAASGRLAAYQQTVLSALEDVENALVRVTRSKEEDARLASAANALEDAATIAGARYQAGAIDLFELLDVQRSLYSAQISAADSQARSATSAVDLFASLAGGWPLQAPDRQQAEPIKPAQAPTADHWPSTRRPSR